MADGIIKSDPTELWHLFSELNKIQDYFNEYVTKSVKRTEVLLDRVDREIKANQEAIERIRQEIASLSSKNTDDQQERQRIQARIAELQAKIQRIEALTEELKHMVRELEQRTSDLEKSQKQFLGVNRKSKKVINAYLNMLEIDMVKSEMSADNALVHNMGYSAMGFRGNTFYTDDSLYDLNQKDSKGRSNLQRMQRGLAPVGKDGLPVELHHMQQSEDGSIIELSGTNHRQNHKALHINTSDIPSGINRSTFSVMKKAYWKKRADLIMRGM